MNREDFSSFQKDFFAHIDRGQSIVITSHFSPDDDSIGSVLFVYTFLKERFPEKNIRIIYTGAVPDRYRVFPRFEQIEWVSDVGEHLQGVDVLVTVDASSFKRFSHLPEMLASVPVRIGFDHHASEADEYTLLLHRKEYSSNTELLVRALCGDEILSRDLAEYALLGILGDTGNFAHISPAHSDVLILAKKLIETVGMSIDQFRSRYGGIPLRIIPLIQALVANTRYVTVSGWPPMQYSFIDRKTKEEGSYTDEDMSAASHIYMGQYLTRVEGYGWGIVVTPRDGDGCRQSGRSLPGSVNVRDFHEKLGIGSGHDRASGGYVKEPEPSVWLGQMLLWMENNKPMIG